MNWDTKLFLKINNLSGKYYWLDLFSRAGAEWVIFGMVGWFAVSLFVTFSGSSDLVFLGFILLGSMWALGMLLSVLIGLIVKEPRPRLRHPEIRLLFDPLSSWKSFPSDHAFSAFLLFFMALVYGLVLSLPLLILALWVGWGRVYAGMHYIFDIIGGVLLAALLALFAYYLLIVLGLNFL